MYLYHMCAWHPQRPAMVSESPGTGVTNKYELIHRSWEPNPSPFAKTISCWAIFASIIFINTSSAHGDKPYPVISNKYKLSFFVSCFLFSALLPHPSSSSHIHVVPSVIVPEAMDNTAFLRRDLTRRERKFRSLSLGKLREGSSAKFTK